MQSVICHNVANLYAEPDDRSECVSQMVFNDRVLGIEQKNGFSQIESSDCYRGWVRDEHLLHWQSGEPNNKRVMASFAEVYDEPDQTGMMLTQLVIGTKLWTLHTECAQWHQVELLNQYAQRTQGYILSEQLAPYQLSVSMRWDRESLMNIACRFFGIPYLWGGTTPFGFDCSGLTQRLYGLWDIVLPRDAYLQYESPLGEKLSESEPYQSGDLVFFVGKTDPRNRGITHVGIMMDKTQVIHAYSKMGVIVTPLAEMTSKLGYTYRGAWRYREEIANGE